MTPEQRDILLVPVPFTDLSSIKRRPVLVLSTSAYNLTSSDILVAAITSNLTASSRGIVIDSKDMEAGTLPKPSLVFADRIYTVSKSIIVKRYGRLKSDTFQQVLEALDDVLGRS